MVPKYKQFFRNFNSIHLVQCLKYSTYLGENRYLFDIDYFKRIRRFKISFFHQSLQCFSKHLSTYNLGSLLETTWTGKYLLSRLWKQTKVSISSTYWCRARKFWKTKLGTISITNKTVPTLPLHTTRIYAQLIRSIYDICHYMRSS